MPYKIEWAQLEVEEETGNHQVKNRTYKSE